MENSSKDLVTIMLDLKTKTICNEAIKARVKTQTVVSSTSRSTTATTGKGTYYNSSSSNNSRSDYNYNNSYSYNRNGRRAMGGPTSFSSSSSRGYYRHDSNQVYSGDRANYYVSKKYSRGSYGYNNNGGSGGSGGSGNTFRKQQDQYHQRDRKDHDSTNVSDDTNRAKKDVDSQPPPPVIEQHYPSLSGTKVGDSSPTSVTTSGLGEQISSKISSSSSRVLGGGYAAALLKEAPRQRQPVAINTKPPVRSKTVTNVPSSKGSDKVRQINGKLLC